MGPSSGSGVDMLSHTSHPYSFHNQDWNCLQRRCWANHTDLALSLVYDFGFHLQSFAQRVFCNSKVRLLSIRQSRGQQTMDRGLNLAHHL